MVSSARATARRRIATAAKDLERRQPFLDGYDAAKAMLTDRIPDFDRAHRGELGPVFGYARHRSGDPAPRLRRPGRHPRPVRPRDRRRFLPRLFGPNRFAGPCAVCQSRVSAGAGIRGETEAAYLTWCSSHVPTETRD